jgi:hypothetical protein
MLRRSRFKWNIIYWGLLPFHWLRFDSEGGTVAIARAKLEGSKHNYLLAEGSGCTFSNLQFATATC